MGQSDLNRLLNPGVDSLSPPSRTAQQILTTPRQFAVATTSPLSPPPVLSGHGSSLPSQGNSASPTRLARPTPADVEIPPSSAIPGTSPDSSPSSAWTAINRPSFDSSPPNIGGSVRSAGLVSAACPMAPLQPTASLPTFTAAPSASNSDAASQKPEESVYLNPPVCPAPPKPSAKTAVRHPLTSHHSHLAQRPTAPPSPASSSSFSDQRSRTSTSPGNASPGAHPSSLSPHLHPMEPLLGQSSSESDLTSIPPVQPRTRTPSTPLAPPIVFANRTDETGQASQPIGRPGHETGDAHMPPPPSPAVATSVPNPPRAMDEPCERCDELWSKALRDLLDGVSRHVDAQVPMTVGIDSLSDFNRSQQEFAQMISELRLRPDVRCEECRQRIQNLSADRASTSSPSSSSASSSTLLSRKRREPPESTPADIDRSSKLRKLDDEDVPLRLCEITPPPDSAPDSVIVEHVRSGHRFEMSQHMAQIMRLKVVEADPNPAPDNWTNMFYDSSKSSKKADKRAPSKKEKTSEATSEDAV